MKRAICMLSMLALTTVLLAEDEGGRSPEAMEILQKVDKAIKGVSSVRYTASSTATGVATNFAQPAEGTMVIVGWNGSQAEMFYNDIETRTPDGDALKLTGGGNGDTYFIIDHSTKKGYEDMDPGVMGSSGGTLQGLAMIEFVHDSPFDDELEAETAELVGEESIGGEACYKIRVVYAGGQGESIWSFSKKDYLPRRRIRVFTIPGQGEGALEITITKLEVEPKVDSDLFQMHLPQGYERIDDFAP